MKNISSTFSKENGFTIRQHPYSGNIPVSIFEEFEAANNKNGIQIMSVNITTVSNIRISQCNVYQNGESGLRILMAYANISTVIEDCLIQENKQSGVMVSQFEGGDVLIKSSTLHKNGIYALEVYATNNIVLESCIFTENSHEGLYEYGSCEITSYYGGNVSFLNNTFSNNHNGGIKFREYNYNVGSFAFNMKFNQFSYERYVLSFHHLYYFSNNHAIQIDISHNIFNNNKENNGILIDVVLTDEDSVYIGTNTFINNTANDILTISSSPYASSVSENEVRIFDNIFKDNTFTDSCLNLKSYHIVSVNRNAFMNNQTIGNCELQTPSFDESYSINATHNYWGSSNMSDIIENKENDEFVAYAQNDFGVQNVFGGEITGTFTIKHTKEAMRISRSIFVRTNASLNIENGIKMQFDEKRGIYIQGNLNVDDGESRSLFTNGPVVSSWYGMVFSTKDTGYLKLHNAYISNTEIGIQSNDKVLDLRNITINNSASACLSMLSGAEGHFDFEGSFLSNCVNYGLFLSKYVNASFTGLDISSSYEGIQLITDQTGHLTLYTIGINNSSLCAVHVEFNHDTDAGDITIHDMEITDSQTGFQLIVKNHYSHNSIKIRDNSFYNISGNAMQIKTPRNRNNSIKTGAQRFVDIGYNTFINTCGITCDTWDSVNISFHDNDITENSCPTIDKCFFSISADGFRDIPVEKPQFSSYPKGTVRFNNLLLNKVSRGVVVLDTSYFNISRNIFDNHDSTFDFYTTGYGDDTINAKENWFGNVTLSLVYDRIYDRRKESSLMSVDITPLLLEWKLDCSLVNNCSNQGQCVSPNRCRCFSGKGIMIMR
ncbi:unnamed protein product [Mytilus edulis]|uniref:Right handed beta helix domain-containing protein n=1 Tax=Mytilus edulis TaxID=6550 RepID=A0A8S3UCN1_MYTED|nr:unnamed protein product [Mytilus edulis]